MTRADRPLLLALALFAGLLAACNSNDRKSSIANWRAAGGGTDQTRPPLYHDQTGDGVERDQWDSVFNTEPKKLFSKDEPRSSIQSQLDEQDARDKLQQARELYDAGELGRARRTAKEALSYGAPIADPARELIGEIDEKIEESGRDPYEVEMASYDKAAVEQAQQTALAGRRRAAELMREGNYESAVSEFQLALDATDRWPAGAGRADIQYQLRALLRQAKRLSLDATYEAEFEPDEK